MRNRLSRIHARHVPDRRQSLIACNVLSTVRLRRWSTHGHRPASVPHRNNFHSARQSLPVAARHATLQRGALGPKKYRSRSGCATGWFTSSRLDRLPTRSAGNPVGLYPNLGLFGPTGAGAVITRGAVNRPSEAEPRAASTGIWPACVLARASVIRPGRDIGHGAADPHTVVAMPPRCLADRPRRPIIRPPRTRWHDSIRMRY